MDKVRFNQNSEILAEDLNAIGVYTEDALQNVIIDFLNDGNIVAGLKIKAQPIPGLAVYAEPGRIYQNGLQGELSGNSEAIVITAPPAAGKRIDRICVKYSAIEDLPETRNFIDVNSKQITNVTTKTRVHGTAVFQVIAGTASASPAAPAVPKGWVSIAQVVINAGVNGILQTDILDERPTISKLLNHSHTGGGDGIQIDHKSLMNCGVNTHTQIDSHIANTNNPHKTTAEQVGALSSSGGNIDGDLVFVSKDSSTWVRCEAKGASLYFYNHTSDAEMFRINVDNGTCEIAGEKVFTVNQIGTAIGKIPALVDVGGGKAGLPAVSGKLLTDISGMPVGGIIAFPVAKVPPGFLKCNGQAVGRATYPDLFATIGTIYGKGDDSTTFNLPDFRGEFMRGFDDGRGVDAGRVLGTAQQELVKRHYHRVWLHYPPHSRGGRAAVGGSGDSTSIGTLNSISTTEGGTAGNTHITAQSEHENGEMIPGLGTETRPRNVAMVYCIKAFDAPVNQAMIDMTELANDVAGKVNLTDFTGGNQNLAVKGFQKLPGGLVMQWGLADVSPSGSEILFPLAFANQPLMIVSTAFAVMTVPMFINSSQMKNTGFILDHQAEVTRKAYWFAIGY